MIHFQETKLEAKFAMTLTEKFSWRKSVNFTEFSSENLVDN